jgi:lipoprotein-anchoring transpeptidase ErfK/SrfK
MLGHMGWNKIQNSAVLAVCLLAGGGVDLTQAAAKQFSIVGAVEVSGGLALPRQVAVNPHPIAPGQARALVDFSTSLSPGSIMVRTAERKLYFILPSGKAIAYVVAVGREGFAWSGTNAISRKAEWPDWRPPPQMVSREADAGHIIPAVVKGGPGNPLGARALYLGDSDYRIHGTDKPWSIGQASSSGCIRMLNENVTELYDLVKIGAKVVVE